MTTISSFVTYRMGTYFFAQVSEMVKQHLTMKDFGADGKPGDYDRALARRNEFVRLMIEKIATQDITSESIPELYAMYYPDGNVKAKLTFAERQQESAKRHGSDCGCPECPPHPGD